MVQLIAYAPEDGWGFAREGESILLLKPPYGGDRIVVRAEDVERAVTVHGYLASNLRFNTERDLIQHLRDEVVRSWPLKNTPEELREDLLLLANPEEIDFYLKEAAAWLRDGRTSEVETLSNRLFTAKELTYPQRLRVAGLLETVRSQRYAERQAKIASKFSRMRKKSAIGAPTRNDEDTEQGVLCPATAEGRR